jgi:hypothetical protein
MNCTKCEVLLHALIDDERDAGHTSDVETHIATCSGCTETLKTFSRDARGDGGCRPQMGRRHRICAVASRPHCLCLWRQLVTVVCTENLNSGVVVVKSAKDGV